MNVAELQEKVNNAELKVKKIENIIDKHKAARLKKIERVKALIEQYNLKIDYDKVIELDFKDWYRAFTDLPFYSELCWAEYDVRDKDRSIADNLKKLEEAKKLLKNWQEKLRLEQVKLQYIQDNVPEVIKDFLNQWKARVIKYYTDKAEAYPDDLKEYKEKRDRLYFDILKETVKRLIAEDEENFYQKYCYGNDYKYNQIKEELLNNDYKLNNMSIYVNLVYFSYSNPNKVERDARYVRFLDEWNSQYGEGFFKAWISRKFDPDWLEKEIEEEKNNKLIDLMTRVSKVTGEIIDASHLSIKEGNLNGYIIGKDGNAEVETIGAGGYNVQVYHYRTLIKPRR